MKEFKDGKKYKLNIKIENELDSHVIMINYVKDNSVVLDVGCACGDLGVILKNSKNCQCYGIEYDEKSVEIAKATKAYIAVEQADLDLFTSLPFNVKFDAIIFGDVLEHCKYPYAILEKFKKYLKKDGKFVISLPNISHAAIKSNLLINNFNYTPYGILDNTHLRFFTYKTISENLAHMNLIVEECHHTFDPKTEMQPVNAFKALPAFVQYYILKDYFSYVEQFVILVSSSDRDEKFIFNQNMSNMNINGTNAHPYIKNYRKRELFNLIFVMLKQINPIKKCKRGNNRTITFCGIPLIRYLKTAKCKRQENNHI